MPFMADIFVKSRALAAYRFHYSRSRHFINIVSGIIRHLLSAPLKHVAAFRRDDCEYASAPFPYFYRKVTAFHDMMPIIISLFPPKNTPPRVLSPGD